MPIKMPATHSSLDRHEIHEMFVAVDTCRVVQGGSCANCNPVTPLPDRRQLNTTVCCIFTRGPEQCCGPGATARLVRSPAGETETAGVG